MSLEYDYLGPSSDWFYEARNTSDQIIKNATANPAGYYIRDYHSYGTESGRGHHHEGHFHSDNNSEDIVNNNNSTRRMDEILTVKYEHGRWNNPYYDCGGGNIWMMTYTVPFFGFDHTKNAYYFK